MASVMYPPVLEDTLPSDSTLAKVGLSAGKECGAEKNAVSGPLVQIVLATFNGGRYLREQLQTLEAQTHQNIEILVADDGSVDNTPEILTEFQESSKLRLRVAANPRRLFTKGNFANLLTTATADYVMCCDQDDRWDADKVEITLNRMLQAEAAYGAEMPVLVFTDARLIDAEGKLFETSYWTKAEEKPEEASLRNLLVQNVVSGCTVMVNRALLNRALPMPVSDIVMHDYWLALVAACFGILCPISKQTLGYRRHGENVTSLGADSTLRSRLRRLFGDPVLQQQLLLASRQGQAFLARYPELSLDKQDILRGLIAAVDAHGMPRRWIMLRHRLFRTGLRNQLKFFLRL